MEGMHKLVAELQFTSIYFNQYLHKDRTYEVFKCQVYSENIYCIECQINTPIFMNETLPFLI